MRDPKVKPNCDCLAFAKATIRAAEQRFGAQGKETDAVRSGWEAVKVAL